MINKTRQTLGDLANNQQSGQRGHWPGQHTAFALARSCQSGKERERVGKGVRRPIDQDTKTPRESDGWALRHTTRLVHDTGEPEHQNDSCIYQRARKEDGLLIFTHTGTHIDAPVAHTCTHGLVDNRIHNPKFQGPILIFQVRAARPLARWVLLRSA